MQTISDIANEIHGTDTVAIYISPNHNATLARATQRPGSEQLRIHHLLMVFVRQSALPSEPCLVVCSETPEGGGAPVLTVYDPSGCQTVREQQGDLTDLRTFGRKAVALAGERLGTRFNEQEFRRKSS
jgi:hypothetical protein